MKYFDSLVRVSADKTIIQFLEKILSGFVLMSIEPLYPVKYEFTLNKNSTIKSKDVGIANVAIDGVLGFNNQLQEGGKTLEQCFNGNPNQSIFYRVNKYNSITDRKISGKYYYWPEDWVKIFDSQLSYDVELESVVYVDLSHTQNAIELKEIDEIGRRSSLLSNHVYSCTDLVNPLWIIKLIGVSEVDKNTVGQSVLLDKKWYSMSGKPNSNSYRELIAGLVSR